jgi:hypothetical protein
VLTGRGNREDYTMISKQNRTSAPWKEEHKIIHGVLQTEQLAGTEMLTDKDDRGTRGVFLREQIVDYRC